MGKVYGNLMVDMQATNVKLVNRAKQMIRMATGAPEDEVEQAFQATNGHVKTATVMIATNSPYEQAATLLEQSQGFVREAIRLGRSD
jgi:N-acetylmuramic acid 6-phosphate etherase